MAYTFNPFTGNFDIADVVTFSPPAVDLSDYEKIADSEARDQDLQDQIDELEKNSFDDAPSDGETYGRKDASWVTITVFVDAPVDGKQYVRKDGVWEEVTLGSGDVEEAPEDGKIYARQDADWVEITDDGTGMPEPPDDGVLYGRKTESGTSEWAPVGSGNFEEPPADDKPYVRSTPSTQADPANPVGEWQKIYHKNANRLVISDSNPGYDDGVRGDGGFKQGDQWFIPKTGSVNIFRYFDLTGQNEWVECSKSPSSYVNTITSYAPIAKGGNSSNPILSMDLKLLSSLP